MKLSVAATQTRTSSIRMRLRTKSIRTLLLSSPRGHDTEAWGARVKGRATLILGRQIDTPHSGRTALAGGEVRSPGHAYRPLVLELRGRRTGACARRGAMAHAATRPASEVAGLSIRRIAGQRSVQVTLLVWVAAPVWPFRSCPRAACRLTDP